MKNISLRLCLTTTLGLAALVTSLTAAPETYAVVRPPSKAVVSIRVTPPPQMPMLPLATVTAPPVAATDPIALPTEPNGFTTVATEWVNIKDYTYAQRVPMLSGLKDLQTRVDTQIEALNTKRATMTESTRTADWDFAMKEMTNARAYFRFTCEELAKATPESWQQQRDRVGLAWDRAQNAFGSVKSSTTM